jgi:tetratricopeptide (TPR) repeat protein
MATATEKGYAAAKLDELEAAPLIAPDATDDGRRRFDVRRTLDITAFGVQAFTAPSGVDVVREHDELAFDDTPGQEELYLVVNGAATFEIDGEEIETPAGSLVFVKPEAKRKATAKEDGTRILAIGGTAGKAYEPAPIEAVEAFAAYGKGDYQTAVEKYLVVVDLRPKDAVARFNAACFLARAGRPDEAFEHLGKAVELNERIKELMAGDEDLDSIREDPRFAAIAK